MNPFDNIDFSLQYGNFDPSQVQVDETINAVFVIDISPSVGTYIHDLNNAFNDFVQTMQNSHVADQLMVSVLEFDEKVKVRSGFQPITQVPPTVFKPQGTGTALYDATLQGVHRALDYRNNLEASGINAKTLVFVITDGGDNASGNSAKLVAQTLSKIKQEEKNAFSFTTIMFGVGSYDAFQKAQKEMGIDLLAKVGTSGAEIRKMIGFISQSISKTATGNRAITF